MDSLQLYTKYAFEQGFKAICNYIDLHEMRGDDLYKLYFGLGVLSRRGLDLEVLARHKGLIGKMFPSMESASAYTELLESYGIGIPVNVDTFKLLVVNEVDLDEYPKCCGPHLLEYLALSTTLEFYQKFLIAATLLIGSTAFDEMQEADKAVENLLR